MQQPRIGREPAGSRPGCLCTRRMGVGMQGGGPAFTALARPKSLATTPSIESSASNTLARRLAPNIAAVSIPVPKCSTQVSRRGSLLAALSAASTPEAFEAALKALIEDRYAATTNRSRASWLKTWLLMHEAVCERTGHNVPPFPLTPDGIYRIAALFKAGGYLSFDNYMLRAKAEHVVAEGANGEWSRALDRACKDCMRSVGRGAGAARQSSPLDVLLLASLGLPCDPVVEGGPWPPSIA